MPGDKRREGNFGPQPQDRISFESMSNEQLSRHVLMLEKNPFNFGSKEEYLSPAQEITSFLQVLKSRGVTREQNPVIAMIGGNALPEVSRFQMEGNMRAFAAKAIVESAANQKLDLGVGGVFKEYRDVYQVFRKFRRGIGRIFRDGEPGKMPPYILSLAVDRKSIESDLESEEREGHYYRPSDYSSPRISVAIVYENGKYNKDVSTDHQRYLGKQIENIDIEDIRFRHNSVL